MSFLDIKKLFIDNIKYVIVLGIVVVAYLAISKIIDRNKDESVIENSRVAIKAKEDLIKANDKINEQNDRINKLLKDVEDRKKLDQEIKVVEEQNNAIKDKEIEKINSIYIKQDDKEESLEDKELSKQFIQSIWNVYNKTITIKVDNSENKKGVVNESIR